jgi:hypothetical protein
MSASEVILTYILDDIITSLPATNCGSTGHKCIDPQFVAVPVNELAFIYKKHLILSSELVRVFAFTILIYYIDASSSSTRLLLI